MLMLIALGAFNVYIDLAGQVLVKYLTGAIRIPYNNLQGIFIIPFFSRDCNRHSSNAGKIFLQSLILFRKRIHPTLV